MIIRKFYNAEAVETPAAAEVVTETVVETPATPSLVEMMAKNGVMNNGNMVVTPTNTESTEKPTETETTPAAIATEAKVEEVNAETPTPTPTVETTPTPQIVEAQKPQETWQEVAQKQPNDVLKALGFNDDVANFVSDLKELDPKMVAFLNTWKSGGDVTGYLREMTTDYTKLSAEEVMRHHIRQSYPKADERQLEILYRTKVVNAYNLNSMDEDELEEGKLLLEAEAEQFREKYIESQKEFLLPKPQEVKAVIQDNSIQEKQAEADRKFNEMYKSQVDNNALTKNIIANKVLPVGEGETKFNFPVEPNEVIDVLYNNGDKWQNAMWEKTIDENGNTSLKPKVEHQLLVATVAKYGMGFIEKIKEHYTSLGANKVIAPIENAKIPENQTGSQSAPAPKTAAEAMAMKGRINSGGQNY
ncbi:MAG: hypothetical protein K1X77_10530 [Bacteroidia bacterium]|nr:hypothetical protein [Bacteroidia bacterium]